VQYLHFKLVFQGANIHIHIGIYGCAFTNNLVASWFIQLFTANFKRRKYLFNLHMSRSWGKCKEY